MTARERQGGHVDDPRARDALLDAGRHVGDPPADAVVARLGHGAWGVNALLRDVRRNDQPLPAGVPADVHELFATHTALPAWLDLARVRRAQRWADAHVFHVTTALFFGALPTAYAAARGARVLVATGRMGDDLVRRLSETAHFVLDVITPGSLEPGGHALRSVQKVRLVHAAVRHALAARGDDDDDDEVPINQEDLLGTMFTFSLSVLRGVRRLGVAVDPRDADDYYHLWRGVGAMLGIHDAYLPRDEPTAFDVALRVAERQFRASEQGRLLMSTLLARTREPLRLPGFGDVPAFLTRYLAGDHIADLLGVPVERGFPRAVERLARVPGLGRVPVQAALRALSARAGRPLLRVVSHVELRGERPSFPMPQPHAGPTSGRGPDA